MQLVGKACDSFKTYYHRSPGQQTHRLHIAAPSLHNKATRSILFLRAPNLLDFRQFTLPTVRVAKYKLQLESTLCYIWICCLSGAKYTMNNAECFGKHTHAEVSICIFNLLVGKTHSLWGMQASWQLYVSVNTLDIAVIYRSNALRGLLTSLFVVK